MCRPYTSNRKPALNTQNPSSQHCPHHETSPTPSNSGLKFPDGRRIQCGLLAQGRGYDALKSFRHELARHGVSWYEV